MSKLLNSYSVFFCFLLQATVGIAQTVNQGILSIGSGTQMGTLGLFKNDITADFINDGDLFLYNHFENDGYFSFTPGISSGMVRFRGQEGYQNILGDLPIDLNNVEFNNVSDKYAFRISNEIAVFGKADFQKGIVKAEAATGSLVFEDGATAHNADDDSYVEGVVQKIGDDSFIFPIGQNNKYRYAGITAPKSVKDAFTQKYFYENPNALYPLSSKSAAIELINDKEYWVFEKKSAAADVMLTLSWDDATTPSGLVSGSEESIHIARWDVNTKSWVDEGGVVDKGSRTVTTPVNVAGYGVFTIAKAIDSSSDKITFYNGISPNGDGENDYFKILGLNGGDNTVEIYNRWGSKVYQTKSYDTHGNVFRGLSEAQGTIGKGAKLPAGTYFYVLTYNLSGTATKKVGYLYINY